MNERVSERRVFLVRHAQAADAAADLGDFDRPLTRHGRNQCGQLRAWLRPRLAGRGVEVRVSPALRARQTAETACENWFEGALVTDERLWNATPGTLAELLESAPGDLVLVGHNPGLEQVQRLLAGRLLPLPTAGAFELAVPAGDPTRGARLVGRFQPPPSDSR